MWWQLGILVFASIGISYVLFTLATGTVDEEAPFDDHMTKDLEN